MCICVYVYMYMYRRVYMYMYIFCIFSFFFQKYPTALFILSEIVVSIEIGYFGIFKTQKNPHFYTHTIPTKYSKIKWSTLNPHYWTCILFQKTCIVVCCSSRMCISRGVSTTYSCVKRSSSKVGPLYAIHKSIQSSAYIE